MEVTAGNGDELGTKVTREQGRGVLEPWPQGLAGKRIAAFFFFPSWIIGAYVSLSGRARW